MRGRYPTRRQFLLGVTAGTAALAGCTGGGGNSNGGTNGTTTNEGVAGGTTAAGVTPTATRDESPDPNCALLSGAPTPYDASGTPFVFTFDYVDSWELKDPLAGPAGRNQGLSSPVVTVDGETESAGIRIGQRFESLTASQVDRKVADATEGESNPFEVVHEQPYDGETVRFVGFPDSTTPSYRAWVPYGPSADRRYYPFEMDTLTSILRRNDEGRSVTLCNDPVVTAAETLRESLRPNPASTIEDV